MKAMHPLRAYRRRHNLTLQEFAARSRTGISTISRVENGLLRPSFETFRRIVAATEGELTADELLSSIPAPDAPGAHP